MSADGRADEPELQQSAHARAAAQLRVASDSMELGDVEESIERVGRALAMINEIDDERRTFGYSPTRGDSQERGRR